MVSLALLLYARQAAVTGAAAAAVAANAGCALLAFAVALTVLSLADYSRALARFMV